ncbi:MAG: hypothetical protein R6U21_01385 [Thermoplasmatota archaeon]
MKKQQILQISTIIIVSLVLTGMLIGTDVYAEVQDGIVTVICLSCLKLDPKTTVDFTFQTANNQAHPSFVLDNITDGIVFLHFSEDACPGCDIMLPIIQDLFSVDYEKEEMFSTTGTYENHSIAYFYTNIDHATEERADALEIYDQKHIKGLPMFTVVTLGYEKGIIKPYYASVYGTLGLDTDQKREAFLKDILQDSIDLYDENRPGYQP